MQRMDYKFSIHCFLSLATCLIDGMLWQIHAAASTLKLIIFNQCCCNLWSKVEYLMNLITIMMLASLQSEDWMKASSKKSSPFSIAAKQKLFLGVK